MSNLIRFQISGFKGLASFEASPNGQSLELRGSNGSGKSSAIDSIFWALGGKLDGEVVNNASDRAVVDVTFGDYQIRRAQTKGKAATLTVKDGTGRSYPSPAALLAGFLGAVERQTFSARPAKQQAEILRKLAPGLDCADLDTERARIYDERRDVNRDADRLKAQAEGVVVPAAPESIGEERAVADVVDVAAIVERKAAVATVRAANDRARAEVRSLAARAEDADRMIADAVKEVDRARALLKAAEDEEHEARTVYATRYAEHKRAAESAAALVDPDTTAIDTEIAAAKQANAAARAETEAHNRAVRAAQQQADAAARAAAEHLKLANDAAKKAAEAKALTKRIEQIDAEKAARTAAAALPIPGLALAGDAVTLDDGKHGPVEVAALNTATRIRLDIAIAAALGHRLVAVRDASLLDGSSRAEVAAFARQHGVQTICEVVASGEPLSAVIEEAQTDAAPAQGALL